MVFSQELSFCHTENTYTSRVLCGLRFINKQQHGNAGWAHLKSIPKKKNPRIENHVFTDHVTMVSEVFLECCCFRFAALSCRKKSREEKPLAPGYDHVRMSDKPENRR